MPYKVKIFDKSSAKIQTDPGGLVVDSPEEKDEKGKVVTPSKKTTYQFTAGQELTVNFKKDDIVTFNSPRLAVQMERIGEIIEKPPVDPKKPADKPTTPTKPNEGGENNG